MAPACGELLIPRSRAGVGWSAHAVVFHGVLTVLLEAPNGLGIGRLATGSTVVLTPRKLPTRPCASSPPRPRALKALYALDLPGRTRTHGADTGAGRRRAGCWVPQDAAQP